MPESDLSLLIEAAQEAGRIATHYADRPLDVQYKDADGSPVTAADLAVNRMLEDRLRGARPNYGWLSEESPEDPARHAADRVFVIDPIDGTRSFVEGSKTWAHSLAVVHRGAVEAAVVFLPRRDKLYSASLGTGARLNGAPIATGQRAHADGAEVLAVKANLDPAHWIGPVPDLRRSHRPSLAYRLSLVAEGRYDAMLTLRPAWEWDIAAGALILSEAGARVSDRHGAALRFNNPHPQTNGVLAANPGLHAALLDQLR